MRYLQNFFGEELCPEKRVSAEKYGQFVEYFQLAMGFNPASLLGGTVTQSELILLYKALDHGIDNEENISVAEAAKQLGVSVPFVSKTLKSLEEKGYVQRVSDKNDRRSVRISVTRNGREIIDRFFKCLFSMLNRAMTGFTNGEIETMIDLFGRFIHAVTENSSDLTNIK